MTDVQTIKGASIQRVTPADAHYFFGYYDRSPWDGTDNRLLAHKVEFADRLPGPDDTAELYLLSPDGSDKLIAETKAWNFQLGSMLQWVNPEEAPWVAFNDRRNGSLVTRLVNVDTGEERSINTPTYCISDNGKTAFGVDFDRLHQTRRGYGYAGGNSSSVTPSPGDNGIWKLDLDEEKSELLVSLDRLSKHDTHPSMAGSPHWVNHLAVSPQGGQLAFLHRWELGDGGIYTRLCTIDPDGSNLRTVIDTGRVTHFTWANEQSILAWTREQDLINSATNSESTNPVVSVFLDIGRYLLQNFQTPDWFVSDIVGEQYRLYEIDDETVSSTPISLHSRDGHPTYSPDSNQVVTDTYPTSEERRELYVCNHDAEHCARVASFPSSPNHDQTGHRCDLHPRWNRSGTAICVDSFHEEVRGIYVVELSNVELPSSE